jgi:hypothetical protein
VVELGYPIEIIPDTDSLYMRIHKAFLEGITHEINARQYIPPTVFREHQDGMSTDWSKYSTPYDTQTRSTNPNQNGVIEMNVGKVRQLQLQVLHHPLPINRAHTNVKGIPMDKKLKAKVRLLLARIAQYVIPIPS